MLAAAGPMPVQPIARLAAGAAPSAAGAPAGRKSANAIRSDSTSTDAAVVELRDDRIRASRRVGAATGLAEARARSLFAVPSAGRATSAIDTSPGTRVSREKRMPLRGCYTSGTRTVALSAPATASDALTPAETSAILRTPGLG